MENQQMCDQIFATFFRILDQHTEDQKQPRTMSNGVKLYTSELYTLYAIKQNPYDNITSLAAKLGVTKGAVSQTIKKLEDRELITRYNTENKKEVYLKFTEKGEVAVNEAFENIKEQEDQCLERINQLNEKELKVVDDLFLDLEKLVKQM